eukprot:6182276-Pleurochrysis_carterae.AAC.1
MGAYARSFTHAHVREVRRRCCGDAHEDLGGGGSAVTTGSDACGAARWANGCRRSGGTALVAGGGRR